MPRISNKRLMSLQRRGSSRYAGFRRAVGRRRPKKNDLKRYGKAALFGTGAGLAVSIPLTLAAKYFNRPELMEVGQRAGAVVAAKAGGPVGEIGYQITDAIFDRFVFYQGQGVSGTKEVYL